MWNRIYSSIALFGYFCSNLYLLINYLVIRTSWKLFFQNKYLGFLLNTILNPQLLQIHLEFKEHKAIFSLKLEPDSFIKVLTDESHSFSSKKDFFDWQQELQKWCFASIVGFFLQCSPMITVCCCNWTRSHSVFD